MALLRILKLARKAKLSELQEQNKLNQPLRKQLHRNSRLKWQQKNQAFKLGEQTIISVSLPAHCHNPELSSYLQIPC